MRFLVIPAALHFHGRRLELLFSSYRIWRDPRASLFDVARSMNLASERVATCENHTTFIHATLDQDFNCAICDNEIEIRDVRLGYFSLKMDLSRRCRCYPL